MSNAERRPVVNANSSSTNIWLFIHVCNSLSIAFLTMSKQLDNPDVEVDDAILTQQQT